MLKTTIIRSAFNDHLVLPLGRKMSETRIGQRLFHAGAEIAGKIGGRFVPGYNYGFVRTELVRDAKVHPFLSYPGCYDYSIAGELVAYGLIMTAAAVGTIYSAIPILGMVIINSTILSHLALRSTASGKNIDFNNDKIRSIRIKQLSHLSFTKAYHQVTQTSRYIKGGLGGVGIYYFTKRLMHNDSLTISNQISCSLILGGFLANYIEMIFRNRFTDYFTAWWQSKEYTPTVISWNLPDIAVTTGLILNIYLLT